MLPVVLFLWGQISIYLIMGQNAKRTTSFRALRDWSSQNSGHHQRSSAPSASIRAHRIDKSNLPYKCGLVFFYHVPSTGGATITHWLGEYTSGGGNSNVDAKFFSSWSRNREDGSGIPKMQQTFIEGKKGKNKHGGMDEFVQNIGQNEWKISHCHHSSMHLNVTEHKLSEWRSIVESQGCAFISSVIFRDPLSHTMSLYKHIRRFQSSRETWLDHLRTKSESGHFQTQLDYFLYNFLTRNPVSIHLPSHK